MNSKKPSNKVLFESPSILSGEETEIKKTDFDFEKKLGDGAFGHVWRVRHKHTKETYAMKQVAKEKVLKMQAQFRREVFLMYNLDHPHIAKLFNHFEDDKFFYLIMEICDGGNLFQRLHRQRQFMEFEAGQYFLEVLLAVEYLHSHVPAIIHRDIKPENILLDKDGKVKLTDFGWSNYYSSDNEPRTTVCGTPEYLPPEMVEQRSHTTSADIWCLGVLLYEMLVGHTPFKAQVKQNMLLNISKCKPKYPVSFPAQAKDLISRILVKDNLDRLGVKEIIDHPWVQSMLVKKKVKRQTEVIILPQYNGKGYIENTPVEFKCYKIIGEVKKTSFSNNDTLQSTRRTNQKEESSSISNLTLSDSELTFSDSEISRDMLEEIACRESIRVIKDDIEGKQAGIKVAKAVIFDKNSQIKDYSEIVKDLEGKISQKSTETTNLANRVESLQAAVKSANEELGELFTATDAEALVNKIHEAKQKFMSKSRASEILKKKIATIKVNSAELREKFNEKEQELESLRKELESLRVFSKIRDEKAQIKLLDISKEVLLSQINNSLIITKETVDNTLKELQEGVNTLVYKNGTLKEENICILIEETRLKISKLERKHEDLKEKHLEKVSVILEGQKHRREQFHRLITAAQEDLLKTHSETSRAQKELIRQELQSERLNESRHSITTQEYEKVLSKYHVISTQELKIIKNKTYSYLTKMRSHHFNQKDTKRKNQKKINMKIKELEDYKKQLV